MAKKTPHVSCSIIEAQKRAEFAAECLRILAGYHPRVDSILEQYKAALVDQHYAEREEHIEVALSLTQPKQENA
jgi:hypothetical protein